jgi:Flp pilus assembly protein TadD
MGKAQALSLVLLGAVIVAVFGVALRGQFVWDDFLLIVNNSTLRDSSSLGELLTTGFWNISSSKAVVSETYAHVYRPVTTFALFVQHQWFGLDARGFHAVSLTLHLAISLLVFFLILERVGTSRGAWLGALAGGVVFAIHPSRAETVAWISASTELWMALFVFTGYAVWVRRPGSSILPALLFGAALFAKETAIVIPAVLWVDMYARRGAIDWKRWGVVTGAFSVFVAGRFAMMPLPQTAFVWQELPRRVLGTAGTYLQSTFWPWRPAVEPGFRYTDCSGVLVVPTATLVIGGVASILVVWLVARSRTLRGKAWFADVAWFLLFLAPVMNVVALQGYGLAAERFLYVPIFGVASLFARAIARGFDGAPTSRPMLRLGVCMVLIACAISTERHAAHFRDNQTLWAYELERNPHNLHALELVGLSEVHRDLGNGIALFRRGYGEATNNCNPALAARFALLSTKQLVRTTTDTNQDELLGLRAFYDVALRERRLELSNSRVSLRMELPEAFASRLLNDASLFRVPHATVTMRTMDWGRAEAMAREILQVDPDDAAAWVLLARAQALQQKFEEAKDSLHHARQRAPHNRTARAFERALAHAVEVASRPAEGERAQRLQQAQVNVLLGAPEAARLALQPELDGAPADPALVLAYVRTMVSDRRLDLAEAAIGNAEAAAPEEAQNWQRLRAALPKQ